jgi:hypothetical protein
MRVVEDDEEQPTGRGRPQQYPWDKWLVPNKRVRLYRGTDYKIAPSSLRPQVHVQADRHNGKASTLLGVENGVEYIEIKFVPTIAPPEDFEFEKTQPA